MNALDVFDDFGGLTAEDLIGFASLDTPPGPGMVSKLVKLPIVAVKLPFVGLFRTVSGLWSMLMSVLRLLTKKGFWIFLVIASIGVIAAVPDLRNKVLTALGLKEEPEFDAAA